MLKNLLINKRTVAFHICFISLAILNAQTIDVSSGVKLSKNADKIIVHGSINHKFIIERYRDDTHILDIYSPSLKLQNSKNIFVNKGENLKKIWLNPSGSWIIKLHHLKDKSQIEALAFDNKMRLSTKIIRIDSLKERPDLLNKNLRTVLSLNENLLLLYAPIFENGQIKEFYTRVVNQKMETIQSVIIDEKTVTDYNFIDAILLNDGSFVFISTDKKSDNDVHYINYVNKTGELKTYRFNPVKKIFKKLKFEVNHLDNSLYISGFYKADAERKKDITGADKFFISKLNLNTFETQYMSVQAFSHSFYAKLTGKESDFETPQLFTFYIKDIVPKNDGGAVVLVESYFKNEEESLNDIYFSVAPLNNYSTTTIYNFNDILVYDVDNLGNFTQAEPDIIRKKQVSNNDLGVYSSFFTFNMQDELKLIFLDEIKQEAHVIEESIPRQSKTNKVLLNISQSDLVPIVKMSKQTSPTELIIPSINKNRFNLIKLNY